MSALFLFLRARALRTALLTLVLPAALASSAHAQGSLTPPPGAPAPVMKSVDQLEPRIPINATTTPGDSGGFASLFSITQPGSYYLTGVAGKSGIRIMCDNVTIDLGGFILEGVPGSGTGIAVWGTFRHTTVRHGTIRSWGGGISNYSGNEGIFTDLRLVQNTGIGLRSGKRATVVDRSSIDNTEEGFTIDTGSSVVRAHASGNLLHGFRGQGGGAQGIRLSDCSNGGTGFLLEGPACVVTHSVAHGNQGSGFLLGPEGTATHCTANENGADGFELAGARLESSTSSNNGFNGIVAGYRSAVHACTARYNGTAASLVTGAGIQVIGSAARVEDCIVTTNEVGLRTITGVTNTLIARNTAYANSGPNYVFASAGNRVGPIITASGEITTTNPWANFSL